ncbi:glycosyltransferase family 2 protein [Paraburkholderia aspalathi]|uniref:glycosyltransferase family 2 protein n=1 Tax=Paraburkholderia aspalathi TaxID=1324617 RepID=UPI001B1A6C79|nr:glycosyltransferase family 2 protein [Paraburkholderia aspalathi]CAE6711709.1 N-acetylglucosaminyl-diphospho-decaprenol L-rhamnosyltransferase [Paraburkholderia aspalathi]
MNRKNDLNVVIVNFRTPDMAINCVSSILALEVALPEDIVVVENASPDDSYLRLRAELPSGVRLIRASMNRGFGAGVNLGMVAGTRECVLVLNPDTYFVDCSLEKALDTLEADPAIGLVGLDLTNPDGSRQYSARRFYSLLDIVGRRTSLGRSILLRKRLTQHLMMDAWTPGVPFDAEWVMGTGFVVRRHIFEELSGMDEAYFLYMEDVDLCARIWHAGYRVVCVPGARLVHEHQRQSAGKLIDRASRSHLKSLLRFRNKFRVPLTFPPGVNGLGK